jgi:hypothetical protein
VRLAVLAHHEHRAVFQAHRNSFGELLSVGHF